MKKIKIFSLFGLLSLLFVLVLLFVIKLIPLQTTYKTVKIANTTIKAEVADNPLKQMEGLMSKTTLPKNQGMIFIFNSENYPGIWMMNMSFPIDIMWINKDMKIVDIVENAQPCKINCTVYIPNQKSLYVLEVNSGFVRNHTVKVGDYISFS